MRTLLSALVLCSMPVCGQSVSGLAAISGLVTDPSGASVPGAAVTVTVIEGEVAAAPRLSTARAASA